MKTTHVLCARFSALLLVLLFSSTVYAGPKVEVCHLPPGNLDNFHTIKVSEKALAAHLRHGDLEGPCNAQCATLCDDMNECTIDDVADCEENGCPVNAEPVDCDDSDECTDDLCNPATGCTYETVDSCEPADDVCPCFGSVGELDALGTVADCGDPFGGFNLALALYSNGNIACSGDQCTTVGSLTCGVVDAGILTGQPVSPEQDAACRTLIVANCPIPTTGPELTAPAVNQHLSDGKAITTMD